jgi:hypothetical protein
MNPYQERVVAELSELKHKCDRLGLFLAGKAFQTLDGAEQLRLTRQHAVMGEYADILRERIANFS